MVEIVVARKPDADTELDRLFPPPHASAAPEYQEAVALVVGRQIARALVLLTLLSTAACGKLAGDAAEGAGTMIGEVAEWTVAKVEERIVQFGENAAVKAPPRLFDAAGDRIVGRLITFGRRPLLLKDAENDTTARTLAMLNRGMSGEPSLLSMLHVVGDRPMVQRMSVGWQPEHFAEGLFSMEQLDSYMAARSGQRVIAVGHIEGSSPESASFVAYGPQQTLRVSVGELLALARAHRVQLNILGCQSSKAGAPAGPFYDLTGARIPAMLGAMREAATYGEFLAAMGDGQRPVIVDPAAILTDVSTSIRAFRILGTKKAVSVQFDNMSANQTAQTAGNVLPPPKTPATVRSSRLERAGLDIFLIVLLVPFGLLIPLAQLLRWARLRSKGPSRPATRVERIVAGLERHSWLHGDTRKWLRFCATLMAPSILWLSMTGGDDAIGGAIVTAPVLVLNIAGWSARRSLGRGHHERT